MDMRRMDESEASTVSAKKVVMRYPMLSTIMSPDMAARAQRYHRSSSSVTASQRHPRHPPPPASCRGWRCCGSLDDVAGRGDDGMRGARDTAATAPNRLITRQTARQFITARSPANRPMELKTPSRELMLSSRKYPSTADGRSCSFITTASAGHIGALLQASAAHVAPTAALEDASPRPASATATRTSDANAERLPPTRSTTGPMVSLLTQTAAVATAESRAESDGSSARSCAMNGSSVPGAFPRMTSAKYEHRINVPTRTCAQPRTPASPSLSVSLASDPSVTEPAKAFAAVSVATSSGSGIGDSSSSVLRESVLIGEDAPLSVSEDPSIGRSGRPRGGSGGALAVETCCG
eukprot:m.76074 g.76074  ORF g.76074 m.76074 type:complete len:352 (-) comp10483_c0_seq1:444-1499(-)